MESNSVLVDETALRKPRTKQRKKHFPLNQFYMKINYQLRWYEPFIGRFVHNYLGCCNFYFKTKYSCIIKCFVNILQHFPSITTGKSEIVDYLTHISIEKCKLSSYRHAGSKGERVYSSSLFLTSVLDGVSGQGHAPAAIYPRERPRFPLDRRLCGPQSWSGYREYRKNPLPLPGIEPLPSSS
jgi:hypothetical protein